MIMAGITSCHMVVVVPLHQSYLPPPVPEPYAGTDSISNELLGVEEPEDQGDGLIWHSAAIKAQGKICCQQTKKRRMPTEPSHTTQISRNEVPDDEFVSMRRSVQIDDEGFVSVEPGERDEIVAPKDFESL
jgi:hypothetical protein